MLEVENLTKKYGDFTAVDKLSFTVKDGELFALLGKNGAGKSTTISCMTTILDFGEGRITFDDKKVGKDDHEIRKDFGVVFQQSLLDPILTVRENLAMRAKFHDVPQSRVAELVSLVGLESFKDRKYGVLSGGERRRVDIARALIHSPKTLFLDEPTTGLDPGSREKVWEVIDELRISEGLTVLLTTHYMEETETADHVLIIHEGKELATGTPIELRAAHSGPRLSLEVRDLQKASDAVGKRGGTVTDMEGGAVNASVPSSTAALAILDDVRDDLINFEFRLGSMQDVFLNLTGRDH